jgi:hypothetical protein
MDMSRVKESVILAVIALAVGLSVGLAIGGGVGIFRSQNSAADGVELLDRQAAIAEQDADRAIADLTGTVEQLNGAIGRLETRLRSERARVRALEERQRESRILYQQLIEGHRGADADFDEAIELIESLLAQE